MDSVMNAIQIVLSIFLMIGVGMLLTKMDWLNDKNAPLISRLVVKVALPAMIINNIFTKFTRESLIASASGIIVPFLSMALTLVLGMGLARLIRLPKGRRGVFACMFAFSNSVFIGVPVSKALFGDDVIPFTLLYYIANTTLFWTFGYSIMRRDGGAPKEKRDFTLVLAYLKSRRKFRKDGIGTDPVTDPAFAPARAALDMLSKILPLPLLTFLLCVVLVLLNVKLPKFVMDASSYIGNIVTPLSLFYTGIIITRMIRQKKIRWQKGYSMILLGRFACAPVLLILSAFLFPIPDLMRNALIIQASMPVMAQTPIVAASCGSDEEYAAGGIALTTALSLVFIPLYMYIINAML